MRDGATPLEFIRNNLKPTTPLIQQASADTATAVVAPAASPAPSTVPTSMEQQALAGPTMDSEAISNLLQEALTAPTSPLAPKAGAPAADPNTKEPAASPAEAAPIAPAPEGEGDEIADVPNVPAAENFRKLREKVKHTTKTLAEVKAEKDALEVKVKDYETGKEAPEVVRSMGTRIAELEHFEKLHSLKTSKEYRDAFIRPLEQLQSKAAQMAEEYGVPGEVLNRALGLRNRDLNGFLEQHFDSVGALEMKGVINQMQHIRTKAGEAELEPARVLEQLRTEHDQIQTHRKMQQREVIVNRAKDGWQRAMAAVRQEGKARELIYREGDTKHNENFVKPVVEAAGKEYGKLVRILAEHGLEELPEEVSYALSRMTLLAHASAVSIDSREAALRHAEEIEANTKRVDSYNRPTIGGFSRSTASAPASKPKDLTTAVDDHLNKILSRPR